MNSIVSLHTNRYFLAGRIQCRLTEDQPWMQNSPQFCFIKPCVLLGISSVFCENYNNLFLIWRYQNVCTQHGLCNKLMQSKGISMEDYYSLWTKWDLNYITFLFSPSWMEQNVMKRAQSALHNLLISRSYLPASLALTRLLI